MDLEDEGWVRVPYDGLLEVHDDDGGKKFFSRKYVRSTNKLFKMDYFDSPQNPQEFVDSSDSRLQKQLIPLPIVDHVEEEVKEITKHPILIKEDPTPEPDPIFQVFFKKENEFVEMKMGSPRFDSRGTSLPHMETNPFPYEKKSDDDDDMFHISSPSKLKSKDEEKVIDWGENSERLNVWKWGLSGIGAFCSLGMAAATICIIIFGNGQRHKQRKLRIEFYSDNKRVKQVVQRPNESMSAVNGVPSAKAHITYGGNYEDYLV